MWPVTFGTKRVSKRIGANLPAMPLPKLNDEQVAWIVGEVAAYIHERRHFFYPRAVFLSPNQKAVLQPFFPASTLDSARVIALAIERVPNPYFYPQLVAMGFQPGSLPDFSQMAAITFVDTIVSHGPLTERTLFHELVHTVQYAKLGLGAFAAKYVTGFLNGGSYEAIPLEMNAYELDERFATAPMNSFSVETEVQKWIDAGRF
jgi:hypothetical protein